MDARELARLIETDADGDIRRAVIELIEDDMTAMIEQRIRRALDLLGLTEERDAD